MRRLQLLIRQLPAESATVRSHNGGSLLWTTGDHLTADVWAVIANSGRKKGQPFKDHPQRVAMEATAKAAAKQARVIDLRAKFEKRKRTYGLG